MRGTLKTAALEHYFPLLAVEHDCILSKNAEVTVAYRVVLPELFTLTGAEYEALHGAWLKALRVLPDYTIVHKQDYFTEEHYRPDLASDESFLGRAFERHFNERPFLRHSCYLFITKTSKEQMRRRSDFSSLCRGFIVPQEIRDTESVTLFLDAAEQMRRILCDAGFIRLEPLTADEIVGTADDSGLIARYFALGTEGIVTNEDLRLDDGQIRIGNRSLAMYTLSDLDYVPQAVGTDSRYERFSTDRSDCRLSFAAPAGLLLGHPHIYNQYVFLDNHAETLKSLEARARNMNSLARYSRANSVNKEWIDLYLNEAHTEGYRSVRCHCNVLIWADSETALKGICNDVGSQLALMGCTPHRNTVDVPALFWAGIPGAEGEFPAEESFPTFLEQALCFFAEETAYRSSPSPFGIKLVDRLSGIPLHLDISDEPIKRGITTNRNKFVLGPSGSGKSFFMNHLVRQYYEQNSHIVLIDTGNSYQGLCELIHRKTKGEDGIYYTYTEEKPISFNPFFTDDYKFSVEKKDSIKTLLLALWKGEDEKITKTESGELGSAVSAYIRRIQQNRDIVPSFDTFYEYMLNDYRKELAARDIKVSRKDFNIDNFLTTLRQYYKGGRYDFLLNSNENIDLLHKRFIVFEIDSIKDNAELFPVVTIIIMEAFINKLRRLKGVRKMLICEEAWKALSSPSMSEYLKYMYKTVRKYFGEAIVVTQEVDDIISSPIVKEAIITNSDCKILLDQKKYMNKFDGIQSMLGLTDKEKSQILSINLANHPGRKYKEVWIGLNGVQSAVYATEVSAAEYLTYTTEESEKTEVFALAEELGGDLELAIKRLAETKYK